ncbi:hypothetical protein PQR71_41565 [Paraburkholderia fungorum]|uniref:hypothetical protein n=1 Tax=Paraburkholderia fungorum TaxID=134537 RepID=UPI0038B8B7D4
MNAFNSSHEPHLTRALNSGTQHVYRFANGFGASVVRHQFSYGHEAGMWELAVVEFDGDKWEITYDTGITGDVIGRLSETEVSELLDQIAALAKATA